MSCCNNAPKLITKQLKPVKNVKTKDYLLKIHEYHRLNLSRLANKNK